MIFVQRDSNGRYTSKKMGMIEKFFAKTVLTIIAFDLVWTGIVLMGLSGTIFAPFHGEKIVYKAVTSTVIVTNEKSEWMQKWLTLEKAQNMAEHEYLLAKKSEVEKELDKNRSMSLR